MGNKMKPADRQGLSRSGRPSVFKSKNWALRVVLFFARNPEEELTSPDITLKFGIAGGDVRSALSGAVRAGMLKRSETPTRTAQRGSLRGRVLVYSAGDMLLSLIGERRLIEDRRTEDRDTPDRSAGSSVIVMVMEACAPLAGVVP